MLSTLVLLLNLLPLQKVFSQKTDDSSYYTEAIENVKKVYLDATNSSAPWLNGRMNLPYPYQFEKGSPFFGLGKFEPSLLRYEGIDYPNVPLLYDEFANKLIAYTAQARFELINRRVDGFEMNNHKFIYKYNSELSEAFYEVLYDGKTTVLKRNKKELKEDLVSGLGVLRSIEEKLLYFVKKGDHYFSIKSKKNLLAVFADNKAELQQLIKSKKLNWKKDAERLIVEVVSRYDQLKN